MRGTAFVILCLLVGAAPAGAGEPAQAPEAVARQVAGALAAGDRARITHLAAGPGVDPWLVAEVLCSQQRWRAAEAFAARLPAPGAPRLVAYVAGQEASGRTPQATLASRDAEDLLARGQAAHALRTLSASPADAGTVAGIRSACVAGVALLQLGQPRKAVNRFAQAATDAQALGWTRGAADACGGAGDAALAAGELCASLLWRDRRLALEQGVGDPARIAGALGALGDVHERLGDHASALAFREHALRRLAELDPDVGHPGLLCATSRSLCALGHGDRARALLSEAHELATRAGDRVLLARLVEQVAEVDSRTGQVERALASLRRLRLQYKLAGDRAGCARVLAAEGRIERERGQLDVSRQRLEQALELFRQDGDRPQAIATLWSLGLTAREGCRYGEALAHYEAAREEAEQLELGQLLVSTWHAEADATLAAGDGREAATMARRALDSLPHLVRGFSEEQGAAARNQHARLFEVGGRAGVHLGDEEMLCFFLESGRAGTLLEFLGHRGALQDAQVPDDLAAEELAGRQAEALTLQAYRRAMACGDRREARRARARLDEARDHLKQVIERIQRHAKALGSALLEESAPLDRIASWLHAGEVLVLFGMYREEAVALVITPRGRRIARLGPTRALEDAVASLAVGDITQDPAHALNHLRQLLLAPLELSTDTTRLIVSPDGPLAYVPFAALAPDLEIAFTPSATTYGLLLEDQERRGHGVLAVGDPLYSFCVEPSAEPSVRCGVSLVPLPESRNEVLAIGDVVLLGLEATEAGLRYAVRKRPRWSSVHLACHGLVNIEKPTLSCLALTTQGSDDGFLTALDVFRLRIPTDLVVLSACDSGKGRIVEGEGVLGLMRAFLFAGSPRVIVSLDRVDDAATAALMRRFYELWQGGASTAGALQGAQAHVRAQPGWSHPYYWASWVLYGLPH